MAPWPVWIANVNNRRCFGLLLFIFNTIALLMTFSLPIIIADNDLERSLSLQDIESARFVSGLMWTTFVVGVIIHLPGVVIGLDCLQRYRRCSWIVALRYWRSLFLATCGASDACLSLVIAHCVDTARTIGVWLPLAVDRVQQYEHVQEHVHGLQLTLTCCGVAGFDDYLWMGPAEPKEEGNLIPFSCCDRFFPGPCIRSGNVSVLRRTLYKKGCRPTVEKSIQTTVYLIAAILSASIVIQLVVLTVSKLLRTSLTSSEYERDPAAPAPCWLMDGGLALAISPRSLERWSWQVDNERRDRSIRNAPSPDAFATMDSEEIQRRRVRASFVRKAVRKSAT